MVQATSEMPCVCPCSVCNSSPVSVRQTFTVLSADAVASIEPVLGLNFTDDTACAWALAMHRRNRKDGSV
eukprot:CAMPEP_0202385968 /NCGR_PEP_ID=MMETSP1127-20130417/63823_1 /ASSEMBLY_ACC=CAM_ASM_000462 /TAXON_ID=3047 /ORGANISM="Dunaliella tertiolecta, Strain CCMP1320" /LENGTH=69 /DNA_ID=CAMNT_0048986327 /DNA_START=839 /DNA_END=1048 /DNA_ORIENTATION=+